MVFPEELPAASDQTFSYRGCGARPPPTGAGTTTFAAASPGFTGIDISAEYCSRTVMARAASGNRDPPSATSSGGIRRWPLSQMRPGVEGMSRAVVGVSDEVVVEIYSSP